MSAVPHSPTLRHTSTELSPLKRALRIGLIFGAIAVYIAVVGILPLIDARWIVVDVVSLGDAALIAIGLGAGSAVAARRSPDSPGMGPLALQALLAGAVAGGMLALLATALGGLG